jgi:hypothetical protein
MNFPATNTRLLPSEPLPWLFGSGPDGEFLTPGLCNSEPCRNMGREFCELCHLVQVRASTSYFRTNLIASKVL